jgi:hypothetical protein
MAAVRWVLSLCLVLVLRWQRWLRWWLWLRLWLWLCQGQGQGQRERP